MSVVMVAPRSDLISISQIREEILMLYSVLCIATSILSHGSRYAVRSSLDTTESAAESFTSSE